jgi:hypothetical protein
VWAGLVAGMVFVVILSAVFVSIFLPVLPVHLLGGNFISNRGSTAIFRLIQNRLAAKRRKRHKEEGFFSS